MANESGDPPSSISPPEPNEVNLYSLLKLDRDATPDEVHRAYRLLSTTFHPDKLPQSSGGAVNREEVQHVFLDFKRAHEVLIDPVLRLTYDHYGEGGVALLRKVQQQQREQRTRREAKVDDPRKGGEEEDDDDDETDAGEDGEDDDESFLYERLERLLKSGHESQALEGLRRFMEQHDYHQNLSAENQVQLNLSMEFPPVMDLKAAFYNGREYLHHVQRSMASRPPLSTEEGEYYQQRFKQERGLVDYQINKIRDAQKANLGFTLTSVQPRNGSGAMTGGSPIQPKWSMAMGANASLVYPEVAKIVTLAGQKEEEQRHPVSMFVNTLFQPDPHTQINLTANLSNDESHQFILGSARTFTNQTAVRYNMTLLSKSPLKTPLIFNLKTYRHLKDIGMATGGVSVGADGQMLQWNAKWEAVRDVHKCSVKASMGMLQGNSVELSYRARVQKSSRHVAWLDDYIHLPKRVEVSTVLGRFTKMTAMVTHEITSLATHPTLAFGMEHDLSFGRWTWVWEFQYHNSTFRVPIPILQLGSVADPGAFYARKFYDATYCLLLQSFVADLLHDHETSGDKKTQREDSFMKFVRGNSKAALELSKTKAEAQRQLALMEATSEKKRFLESRRTNGLVILRATYWFESRQDDDTSSSDKIRSGSEIIAMDATKQVQFWVSEGTLSAPSDVPKSSWMGFYDLRTEVASYSTPSSSWSRPTMWNWEKLWRRIARPFHDVSCKDQLEQPQLTVRYSHLGHVYEITVGEREALILPDDVKAQCLGDANFLQ